MDLIFKELYITKFASNGYNAILTLQLPAAQIQARETEAFFWNGANQTHLLTHKWGLFPKSVPCEYKKPRPCNPVPTYAISV